MSSHHESHGRLPIGAGLVLIAWAACQFIVNIRLHSNLLSAAVYHNLIDGIMLGFGLALDLLVRKWISRHWPRNLPPLAALGVYFLVALLIARALFETPKPLGFGVVVVEGADCLVNCGVCWWIWRHNSVLTRAIGFHFLLDASIPLLLIAIGAVAQGWRHVMSVVTFSLMINVILAEARELLPALHAHRAANCHDPIKGP